MSQPPIVHEKIAALELSVRYYAALCRRLERRAEAAELEADTLRERMATLGLKNYASPDSD